MLPLGCIVWCRVNDRSPSRFTIGAEEWLFEGVCTPFSKSTCMLLTSAALTVKNCQDPDFPPEILLVTLISTLNTAGVPSSSVPPLLKYPKLPLIPSTHRHLSPCVQMVDKSLIFSDLSTSMSYYVPSLVQKFYDSILLSQASKPNLSTSYDKPDVC